MILSLSARTAFCGGILYIEEKNDPQPHTFYAEYGKLNEKKP